MEAVPGRRAVEAALGSTQAGGTLLVDRDAARDEAIAALVAKARAAGMAVQWARPERLTQEAGTGRHQGVVLLRPARPPTSLDAVVAHAASRGEDPFIVCLDGVEDPQNLGAVARSALLAGAHAIVVPERGTASLGPGAMRASAGALAQILVVAPPSLPPLLGNARKAGLWTVGADAEAGKPPWALRLAGPLCLVLGSEHEGLSPAVKKALDAAVCIPTPGGELSLNVSAAAAALCFERVRQMQQRQGA